MSAHVCSASNAPGSRPWQAAKQTIAAPIARSLSAWHSSQASACTVNGHAIGPHPCQNRAD
jgi:hypothetical protein